MENLPSCRKHYRFGFDYHDYSTRIGTRIPESHVCLNMYGIRICIYQDNRIKGIINLVNLSQEETAGDST